MSAEPHYKCKPWCPALDASPAPGECTCGAVRNLMAWRQGVKAGLRQYAWWKDGVEYVGTCGSTLEAAISHVDSLHPLQGFPEQVWEK